MVPILLELWELFIRDVYETFESSKIIVKKKVLKKKDMGQPTVEESYLEDIPTPSIFEASKTVLKKKFLKKKDMIQPIFEEESNLEEIPAPS